MQASPPKSKEIKWYSLPKLQLELMTDVMWPARTLGYLQKAYIMEEIVTSEDNEIMNSEDASTSERSQDAPTAVGSTTADNATTHSKDESSSDTTEDIDDTSNLTEEDN